MNSAGRRFLPFCRNSHQSFTRPDEDAGGAPTQIPAGQNTLCPGATATINAPGPRRRLACAGGNRMTATPKKVSHKKEGFQLYGGIVHLDWGEGGEWRLNARGLSRRRVREVKAVIGSVISVRSWLFRKRIFEIWSM